MAGGGCEDVAGGVGQYSGSLRPTPLHPVFARTHPSRSSAFTGEVALVAVSGGERNFGQRHIGARDLIEGPVEAEGSNVRSDRRSKVTPECMCEMRGLHADRRGDLGEVHAIAEMRVEHLLGAGQPWW